MLAGTRGAEVNVRSWRRGALAVTGRPRLIAMLAVSFLPAIAVYALVVRSDARPLPSPGGASAAALPRHAQSLEGAARPMGVAVAGDGTIYVTEGSGEHRIRVLDQQGQALRSMAAPEAEPGASAPVHVAVGPTQEVYVSDQGEDAIRVFAPDGAYIRDVAPPADTAGVWHPLGVGFAPDGRLLVTDVTPGRHRVMVFDPSGNFAFAFGSEGNGDGEFSFPNAAAVDAQGRIYVSDSNNGRVQIFDASGSYIDTISTWAGGKLGLPRGLAIDGRDRMFVADTLSGLVQVYDVSGAPKFLYSFGGGVDHPLHYPNGLALDSAGRVYVTDRENNRVEVWQTY
ncbi:MAG: 6-bladed beta-propeller [Chloroflexi bacterium]|nr:6-bladed beta-propeller [Chloroflexota bacterium]